jgi:1-pyrroline-5-carboxylate dehydrogenase
MAGLRSQQELGEADADIAETIDFCEFYAREALRLSKAELPVQLPGERDTLHLHSARRGRGDSAVEFPCAIMAGMTWPRSSAATPSS